MAIVCIKYIWNRRSSVRPPAPPSVRTTSVRTSFRSPARTSVRPSDVLPSIHPSVRPTVLLTPASIGTTVHLPRPSVRPLTHSPTRALHTHTYPSANLTSKFARRPVHHYPHPPSAHRPARPFVNSPDCCSLSGSLVCPSARPLDVPSTHQTVDIILTCSSGWTLRTRRARRSRCSRSSINAI